MLARLEADTLKNILFEATALASKVFPVPGGPNNKIPFIAFLIPLKNYGIILGKSTASCKRFFALSSYAISSNVIVGHYVIYFSSCSTKCLSPPSYT